MTVYNFTIYDVKRTRTSVKMSSERPRTLSDLGMTPKSLKGPLKRSPRMMLTGRDAISLFRSLTAPSRAPVERSPFSSEKHN